MFYRCNKSDGLHLIEILLQLQLCFVYKTQNVDIPDSKFSL